MSLLIGEQPESAVVAVTHGSQTAHSLFRVRRFNLRAYSVNEREIRVA